MGSSNYGAFQPIVDLAEKAKEKYDDITSGGPIKRLFPRSSSSSKGPKPTAKQLGWADQSKPKGDNDDDDKTAQNRAGKRMLQKSTPSSRSGQ